MAILTLPSPCFKPEAALHIRREECSAAQRQSPGGTSGLRPAQAIVMAACSEQAALCALEKHRPRKPARDGRVSGTPQSELSLELHCRLAECCYIDFTIVPCAESTFADKVVPPAPGAVPCIQVSPIHGSPLHLSSSGACASGGTCCLWSHCRPVLSTMLRFHTQQSPVTRLSADQASMRPATGNHTVKAKLAAGCLRASAA